MFMWWGHPVSGPIEGERTRVVVWALRTGEMERECGASEEGEDQSASRKGGAFWRAGWVNDTGARPGGGSRESLGRFAWIAVSSLPKG